MRLLPTLLFALVGLRAAHAAEPPPRIEPACSSGCEAWATRAPTLNPVVLRLALLAVDCARASGHAESDPRLTIIDYTMPSTARRLWVLDLERGEVLFNELVAHGKGSGEDCPRQFSNLAGSGQSSLGLFLTGDTYEGHNGHSLRLYGLEARVNDNAFDRTIVMHGAWYVNDDFAREHGRLGRSHGCPALDPVVASRVIDLIRGGSLVFAYYPDPAWLSGSRLLNGCEASTPHDGDRLSEGE